LFNNSLCGTVQCCLGAVESHSHAQQIKINRTNNLRLNKRSLVHLCKFYNFGQNRQGHQQYCKVSNNILPLVNLFPVISCSTSCSSKGRLSPSVLSCWTTLLVDAGLSVHVNNTVLERAQAVTRDNRTWYISKYILFIQSKIFF